MEGVSGVVSYEQSEPGNAGYIFGQRMFMSDLMALLEGLNEGGAEEIVIYDEHYFGRNIDLDKLPANASAICGKSPYRVDWAGGLDDSFNGVIFLGFHSKFGTKGGLLNLSYELDIRDLRVNGVSVGEIGMEAAIAGDYGVPVLMVTSDSAGIAEAKGLLPGVVGVVVKESTCEGRVQCYPLSVTKERIHSKAKELPNHPPAVKPYTVGTDVTVEIELNEGRYVETVRRLYRNEMSNDITLTLKGKSATDVWTRYWQKKLRAQEVMES
jgi:D-amino peptidase